MTRATLLAVALLAASAAARTPSRSDRFWASWDGFEVEAYVAMKDLGVTMTKLQAEGSLSRQGDDAAANSWLKEKVGDQLIDWANDINPATKPIKTMSDFAQSKTQAWLDWSFRAKVNLLYRDYRAALRQTGNPKQALAQATAHLDQLLQENMNAKDQRMLQVIKDHRGVIFAQLIKTDSELHPDAYPDDVGKALGDGTVAVDATVPAELAALPEKQRQDVLDCLCSCGSTANQSMVAVYWNPAADDASPSCAKPAQGPCINKGYGCWRSQPASAGDCANRCAKAAGLGRVPRLTK